jgi:uroporphyrinogen-III synthase
LQAAGITPWTTVATERMDEVVTTLLAQPIAGTTVVVQDDGDDEESAAARLAAAGADVTRIPVYRWRLPADDTAARALIAATCDGELHAVTFTSAPAVKNLFIIAERAGRATDLRAAFDQSVVAACVGSVCAEAAVSSGIARPVYPAKGRLGLMIRVLTDALQERRTAAG